jgi:hypothetical protein
VLDLAIDYTHDVWAIGNNGVVNFVWDSIPRGNANPPVMVASATDLSGLAFDLPPGAVLLNDRIVASSAKAHRRRTISRRGE